MEITREDRGNTAVLCLSGSMERDGAAALRQAVETALAEASALEINCARLAYTSSAGATALLAAKRAAKEAGAAFSLVGVTGGVRALLISNGMARLLGVE